ncbi:MAG: ROK family protein [Planctomycetota bacterium]
MPNPAAFVSADQAEAPFFAGVDVGGTSIKIGLVDNRGRALAFEAIPTQEEHGPEQATQGMAAAVNRLREKSGVGPIARVGLVTPGPIDQVNGVITGAGNLPSWWGYPIVKELADGCGAPVRFANDANAACFGEYWRGAGAGCHSVVMLTLGTGVGGGIVVADHLIEGVHGAGGECGHLLLDPGDDAPADSLGKTGSLEAYCGAYSVIRRTKEALDAGDPSSIRKRVDEGEDLTPLLIAQEAEKSDQLALDIVLGTARYLGLAIVTFIHTIDPDLVVLGGAMTFGGAGHPLGERFIEHIRETTRPRIAEPLRAGMRIEFATLGGDAGYIGAAGLARAASSR